MAKSFMDYGTIIKLASLMEKYIERFNGPDGTKFCRYKEGYVGGEQVDDKIMTNIAIDNLETRLTVANIRGLREKVFGKLYRPEPQPNGADTGEAVSGILDRLALVDRSIAGLRSDMDTMRKNIERLL